MITIPIKTKQDAMALFNLFQRKEKQGLEKARAEGLISEEEFLRISAQRAADTLDKFLDKKKGNRKPPTRKSGV